MTLPLDFDRLWPHERALLALGGPLLLAALAAAADWASAQAGGGASQGARAPARPRPAAGAPGDLAGRRRMTAKTPSAQEDLAFMRAIVQPSEESQVTFGQVYFAAGLCYSVQMLGHIAQTLGWTSDAPAVLMAIGAGPSAVFLAAFAWIMFRARGERPGGVVGKAVRAVFGAVGLANLVLILVIGQLALREHSLTIWLIYPCVVMLLQGAAWLVAYTLRRRTWLAVVALGWFLTSVVMAFAIGDDLAYMAATGLGLFAFMLVPGLLMMRPARG